MATYRYLGYGITNDKGIAKLEFDENGDPITHSYTGTGAGELDIIASLDDSSKISDSSIQSETFSVIDAIYNDECTSDTTSNYYLNTNNSSIAYSDGKIVVTALNTNTIYCDLRSIANTVKGKTVSFQCDIVPNNCEVRLEIYAYAGITSNSDWVSTGTSLKIEDAVIPSDATTGFFRIIMRNHSNGSSISFKNFAVWFSD